jgi:hypothetical protein
MFPFFIEYDYLETYYDHYLSEWWSILVPLYFLYCSQLGFTS